MRFARHGVLAAAIHHGQLKGEIHPIAHHADGTQQKVAMVDRECFVPAPRPGHYEPLMLCGQAVTRGQTVGLLHDFTRLDGPAWPVQARVDGIVVAQAWRAAVLQGQHILVVGRRTG